MIKKSMAVSVKNLTIKYDNFVAVENISFKVLSNEVFGLLAQMGQEKPVFFEF